MAGLDETIGVRGVNADIDIGFDEILNHVDMIFAMRAEAQKGPFGIYGELIYIGLSSLEFAAGMHYTNVYERLTLNGDVVAIHQASEQFVTNISDDLRDPP